MLGLTFVTALAFAHPPCDFTGLVREERWLAGGAPDDRIFTITVRSPGPRRGVVVFTHGAGSGGSASWDLQVEDYSFMRRLACDGFDAVTFDARGFGGSSMPLALTRAATTARPVSRAEDAALDLDVVVRAAMKTSTVSGVDLVGWSWGCDVAGLYAGRHPELVRRLVLLAPVYDRRWPSRHETSRAWYPLSRAALEKSYDSTREERAVWDEFVRALFRFTEANVLRLPSGPYRDIYGPDAPIWDAARVTAPTLVVRGDMDPASQEPHAYRLFQHLTNARQKRFVVLGGMGHFLFRERGHRDVHALVADFLEN